MENKAEIVSIEDKDLVQDTPKKCEEYRTARALFDPSGLLSDEQIFMFLSIAKQRKLDPRLRQICAIPKYSKQTGRYECVIVTQIDGFRLIAERTGKYSPGKTTDYIYNDRGALIGAVAYVKKMTADGTWHEVGESAHINEFSSNSYIWKSMPHVMISKCAEARALRRAFPGDLSGIYTQDEINVEDSQKKDKPTEKRTQDITDEVISKDKADDIYKYLVNNKGIEKDLLRICKVKSIEEIRNSQLKACRAFIINRMKKDKEDNSK